MMRKGEHDLRCYTTRVPMFPICHRQTAPVTAPTPTNAASTSILILFLFDFIGLETGPTFLQDEVCEEGRTKEDSEDGRVKKAVVAAVVGITRKLIDAVVLATATLKKTSR